MSGNPQHIHLGNFDRGLPSLAEVVGDSPLRRSDSYSVNLKDLPYSSSQSSPGDPSLSTEHLPRQGRGTKHGGMGSSQISEAELRKRYGCSWPGCQKRFVRPSRLEVHMHTHTAPSYQCTWPGCSRAFHGESNMHRHLRSHKSPASEEQDDDDYVFDSDSSADSRFSIPSSPSSALRRASRNSISSSASSRRASSSRGSLPPFSSFELRTSPRNSISPSASSSRLSSLQYSRPTSPSVKRRFSAESIAHPDHDGPNVLPNVFRTRSLTKLRDTVTGYTIPSDDGNRNGALLGLTWVDDRQPGARTDWMPPRVWTPMFPSANDQFDVSSSPIGPAPMDAVPPPPDPSLRSLTQVASTSSHEPTTETTAEGLTHDDPFDRKSTFCLDGRIIRLRTHATASGGFADVWEGHLDTRKVAVKVMRPFASTGKRMEQSKLLRRLWREYLAWAYLNHPNVLPFLGFTYDFCPEPYVFPSLISPWMSYGTLPSYLEKYPTADRLALLISVADGVDYLHTRQPAIVHGDLRAGNILVSDFGVPCLCDFGLSRVLGEVRGMTTSSELGGSLRWMSPELLHGDGDVSVNSDVWAYGMTVLEILSGKRPYYDLKKDPVVFGLVRGGQIPSRPPCLAPRLLADELWAVCQDCWILLPIRRPSMREVICRLSGYSSRRDQGSP